jgi:hypothetical protein
MDENSKQESLDRISVPKELCSTNRLSLAL